ncbi:MAG: TolC family protein [Puniceicoccales bacterium]|nr:TolC family protein [Puniceicoccales bacterium]
MNFRQLGLASLGFMALTGCALNRDLECNKFPRTSEICYSVSRNGRIESDSNAAALIGTVDLDLGMLIDIALENNPETRKSWHLARVARAHVGQANSTFYPTVLLSGKVVRAEDNSFVSKTTRQKTTSTSYYPGIEIHYSLFQFGAGKDVAEAAKQALYAANCQYDRAIQTVIHNVQRAYFSLCSAESTVMSNEYNLNDALAAYESAFMRYQSGLISIQEYLQAKANKTQMEFELEQSRFAVESARADLANALGVKVSASISVLHPVIPQNVSDVDQSIDAIMEEVVRARPDVAAAYANVRARGYVVHSAHARIWPELVIGGSASRKKYVDASGTFDNFNVFAGISWKIFDGFNNIYTILEMKENLEIARQELRAAETLARTEVWKDYFAFKSANKQLQAARMFEHSARESFDAMVASFGSGLCKFTDLISAQTCLANARRQRIVSENNLLMSLSNLAYSTGGIVGHNLIQSE